MIPKRAGIDAEVKLGLAIRPCFEMPTASRGRVRGLQSGSRATLVLLVLIALVMQTPRLIAAQSETRFFEMRTYYAAPGKLEDLVGRFRDHTTKLFEKHGMANIGYWLPETN